MGSTQVEIFDEDGERLGASWSRDGATGDLVGGPITDAELADDLSLSTMDGLGDLWEQASVGDRVVDVAGKLALLHLDQYGNPTVWWEPTDGVLAGLRGGADSARLLEIARTVAPVSAEDERLLNAWR